MSADVDAKIASLNDWRGALLARIRQLIKSSGPEILEEVKWRKVSNPLGVPTWSHAGIICTGETYRDKIKLTFPHGSALGDPHRLFNASLTGVRRAIDFQENDGVDEGPLQDLIRAAAAFNTSRGRP